MTMMMMISASSDRNQSRTKNRTKIDPFLSLVCEYFRFFFSAIRNVLVGGILVLENERHSESTPLFYMKKFSCVNQPSVYQTLFLVPIQTNQLHFFFLQHSKPQRFSTHHSEIVTFSLSDQCIFVCTAVCEPTPCPTNRSGSNSRPRSTKI